MFVRTHPIPAHAAQDLAGGSAAASDPERRLAGARVLVVVDDEDERHECSAVLASSGLRATGVANAWDAMREVALAAGAGAPYDLVLADAELPGMNGADLARRLRDAQHGLRPFLLLAARGAAAPAGALARPLTAASLEAACRAALAAEAVPATDPLAALPGVDASIGRASTRGNDQLYKRLLLLFLKSQRDFAGRFAAAVAGPDASAPTRLAHDLKATAGSLGMIGLQGIAAELEAACLDGETPSAALLDRVGRGLEPILAGLERLSAQQTS